MKDTKKVFKLDNHIIELFYNKMNNIIVIYYNYNNNNNCMQLFYDSYNKKLLYNYNNVLTDRQKKILEKKCYKIMNWYKIDAKVGGCR